MKGITLADLKRGPVAVLGLGVNNAELTRWLVEHGVKVTVCDEKGEIPSTAFSFKRAAVGWQLGAKAFADLQQFTYLFRTPGLRPDHPAIVAAVKQGRTRLTSQTELFFDLCPAPIVGITGTKGKGTTASLLFSMLKEGSPVETGFKRVWLAGNIGQDPFAYLDKITQNDVVLLELSSFQLFSARVKPKVAIILSLSPDHLDYHQNIHEYVAAKSTLIRSQDRHDLAILHEESRYRATLAHLTKAKVYTYSRRRRVNRGTYVAYNGTKQAIFITGESEPLLYADDLRVPGAHNLENAAAAALAAYLLGVSRQNIAVGAKDFTGLPHRLQKIASFNGVDFIDDSIATTAEAVVAAIRAFIPHPIHLLAGGVSKGTKLTKVATAAKKYCASVTLIGRDAPLLARLFTHPKPFRAGNMEEAVRHIMTQARPGDVVLLAPACASFDLYANYAARGDDFARRVKANQNLMKHDD